MDTRPRIFAKWCDAIITSNFACVEFKTSKVISIDKDNNKAVIDFYNIGEVELSGEDLKNLDLGYAITCHKAQGSEWDKVLVIEENFPFAKVDHARWLYTAATRAAEKLVIVTKE